jgi:hypothetical protein
MSEKSDLIVRAIWAWSDGDGSLQLSEDVPADLALSDSGPTILVNDVFAWGCADCEPLTQGNIAEYERAISDLRAALPFDEANEDDSEKAVRSWAGTLFAARRRKLQPQFACYPNVSTVQGRIVAGMLDSVGPMRPVDIGNPYRHPSEGGGYAYTRACDEAPETKEFWRAYSASPEGHDPT